MRKAERRSDAWWLRRRSGIRDQTLKRDVHNRSSCRSGTKMHDGPTPTSRRYRSCRGGHSRSPVYQSTTVCSSPRCRWTRCVRQRPVPLHRLHWSTLVRVRGRTAARINNASSFLKVARGRLWARWTTRLVLGAAPPVGTVHRKGWCGIVHRRAYQGGQMQDPTLWITSITVG